MERTYSRILKTLAAHPWAILPTTLETICGIIEARANGAPSYSAEEIRAVMKTRAAAGTAVVGNGSVAVISLSGVLANRMNTMSDMSGGTSLERFRAQFRLAMTDQTIKAIVVRADSPGGSVVGCPETWTEIMKARGIKPIVASVDALMASAALWVCSACDSIEITPSGEAGSLGVYTVHCDYSGAAAQAGVKVTYIASSISPHKTEGNEDEPLSPEALAFVQSQIDQVAQTFLTQVAQARKVAPVTAQKAFGGGRCLTAKDALAAKLVDRIATFDETVARLMAAPAAGKSPLGARTPPTPPPCKTCDGSGECADCKGTGEVTTDDETTDCATCDGTGNCQDCNGTGSAGMKKKSAAGRIVVRPGDVVGLHGSGSLVAVIPSNPNDKMAPKDTPWAKPNLSDFTDQGWDDLSADEKSAIAQCYLYSPKMPPDQFADLLEPHHRPSDKAVVFNGCVAAAGRLNQSGIPSDEVPQAKAHLRAHYKAFGVADEEMPPSIAGLHAGHLDVGRGEDGAFKQQCSCDKFCACMDQAGDGTDTCPANCPTCKPDCPCVVVDNDGEVPEPDNDPPGDLVPDETAQRDHVNLAAAARRPVD